MYTGNYMQMVLVNLRRILETTRNAFIESLLFLLPSLAKGVGHGLNQSHVDEATEDEATILDSTCRQDDSMHQTVPIAWKNLFNYMVDKRTQLAFLKPTE